MGKEFCGMDDCKSEVEIFDSSWLEVQMKKMWLYSDVEVRILVSILQ